MYIDVSKHTNLFNRDVTKTLIDLSKMLDSVQGDNLYLRKKDILYIKSVLTRNKLFDENTTLTFYNKKLLEYVG